MSWRYRRQQTDGSEVEIDGGTVIEMEVTQKMTGKQSMESGTILIKVAGW